MELQCLRRVCLGGSRTAIHSRRANSIVGGLRITQTWVLREMRPIVVLQGADAAIKRWRSAISRQSERSVLLSGILLASAVSGATAFVLIQYYSIDVLSSLVFDPKDCTATWNLGAGRHCFSDYGWAVGLGKQSNPWEANSPVLGPNNLPTVNDYPGAGIAPQQLFALLGGLLHSPRLGLWAYLLVLAVAVLSPAFWATRGARGLEKVVVFVALGAAAIPVWSVVDRGNSAGFVTPIALVFLVALCRHRWGIVTITVIVATLLRPQFIVLAVALFAARQWRLGCTAVGGAVMSQLAAYLLWPRDFPETIVQSVHNVLAHGSSSSLTAEVNGLANASFTWVLSIPDQFAALRPASTVAADFFVRSLIGYAMVIVIVVCVLALGRRIPPVIAGMMLLATASLFPTLTYHYYLVFALPIAAVVARAPDGPPGSGIFDRFGGQRRAVTICVALAAVFSISYIALPVRSHGFLLTTRALAPSLWLIVCAVSIVSYARRPQAQIPKQESFGVVDVPPNQTDAATRPVSETGPIQ